MDGRFAPLFAPLTVRGLTLRNRIVCPPMVANRGLGSAEARAWYGALARGGAGLVIVESTAVQRVGDTVPASDLAALAEVVHAGGAVAVLQLSLAPVGHAAEPRHFTEATCRQAIELFGAAARVAAEAGFDGVEAHGAHGFLLNQFFSPLHNKRGPAWGGELAGRMRLGLEIARACRAAVGDRKLVLYRHTPVERAGYTLEDSLAFARELVAAGVDVLDISPSSDAAPGDLAAPFRALGLAPVIAVGRMGDPERALDALTAGRCDLVAIGRGLIADPDWPVKIESGRHGELIVCTECNEGCYASLRAREPVHCVQRP